MQSRLSRWRSILLLPHPVLSVAYLLSVRVDALQPRFAPLIVLTAFPLAAAAVGVIRLRRNRGSRRTRDWVLLLGGALELAWAVVSFSIIGFAIAWRSG